MNVMYSFVLHRIACNFHFHWWPWFTWTTGNIVSIQQSLFCYIV